MQIKTPNKKESIGLKNISLLIVVLFIAAFFDFLFSGLRYIQYALTPALTLVILFFFSKKGKGLNMFRWLVILFIILFIRGLLRDNYNKYILGDIISFSFSVFILFFNSNSIFYYLKDKIPILMAKLLIIFIPLSLFAFLKYGNISSGTTRALISDGNINEKVLYYPILFAPLLLPFMFDMKLYLKVTIIFANLLLILFGIMTATRGMFAMPIIAFLLVFVLQKKISIKRIILLCSMLFVFFQFVLVENNTLFNEKVDYLFSRIEDKKDVSGGRNSEIYDLFKEFNITEFIIGRGAGGTQKFGFWKEIDTTLNLGANMGHYGFTHLLLKGGFLLLFTIYGLALWSIINLYRRGDRKFMIVILIYLMFEISHNQFNNLAFLLLFWISISYSLKLSSDKIILKK
tara:strand:- start:37 stop:1242 length:1206 start_codon:yes stop_codon:yes gene_type:complete